MFTCGRHDAGMSKPSFPSLKRARRWTAVEGRAALTALASSGLSLSEFSRREGLDAQRLRAWKQRLATAGPLAATPTFVEITRRAVERVEIVFPSGVMLRVAETVEPNALRRIVEAVGGVPQC